MAQRISVMALVISGSKQKVTCHAVKENILKCLVFLLDLYIKKLLEKDFLYLTQTLTPEDPDAPWYKVAAVGKDTLSVMVKEMCAEAGIGKKQTIVCMLLLLVPCLGQTS